MKKLFLIASVLLAALVVSCKKETPVEDALTLNSAAEVAVPVEGDVVTIKFNTNVAWTAASDQAWLTLTPASGEAGDASVKASAVKNESYDARTAEVTITAGTKTAKVKVTQGQTDGLSIATAEYVVPAEGGEVEVTVSSNVDYEVVIPEAVDWITVSKTKGMTDSKVVLNVAATQQYAPEYLEDWTDNHIVRTANVTIKSGSLSSVISVGQKTFTPYFEYTGDWAGLQWSYWEGVATPIPQEGADIVIPVETNLEWRVYFSVWDNDLGQMVDSWDLGWARLSYDVDKAEIHLVIDANETYFARENYLYAECFVDGVSDGSFGGLGYFVQAGKEVTGASASLVWKKNLADLGIPAAYNRLAFKMAGGNALLVSDESKVHVVSPADGTYWKAITWNTVKPTSICSDDAGNVIVAETQSAATGSTYKVYYAENVNEEPVELFSHTSDFEGKEIGSWRVRGDINNGGIITGLITMDGSVAYWGGWEIRNKAVAYDNYYVSGTAGQNRGPLAGGWSPGSPIYGAVIARGSNANDGIFYRGYDGQCNLFYLATAAYPNWVTPYDWQVVAEGGNSGNVNQNNIAVAEYNGKRVLAYTQGFHFNYSYDLGFIVVMDVTTDGSFQPLLTIDATDYLDFESPFLWQSSADVLLHPAEDALELYVVNSGLGVLAKYNIVF